MIWHLEPGLLARALISRCLGGRPDVLTGISQPHSRNTRQQAWLYHISYELMEKIQYLWRLINNGRVWWGGYKINFLTAELSHEVPSGLCACVTDCHLTGLPVPNVGRAGSCLLVLTLFNCIKQYLTLNKQLIILVYNQTSWSYIPDDLALGARLAGPCFNFEVFGGQARRTDGYLPKMGRYRSMKYEVADHSPQTRN